MTSQDETTTSTCDLGSQCNHSIGASQRDHHNHYAWCTSCDLEDDLKQEEDILATCLHLDDVDIKDGEHYVLNLPQPRLPTSTIFAGAKATFSDWARELRAYVNISQFYHTDPLDYAYDAEQPLTTDIMVQQTVAG